jgi:hypothetical protein
MRADGHGVESTCAVLGEQGVQIVPRTNRSWKNTSASTRAETDAAIVGVLVHLADGWARRLAAARGALWAPQDDRLAGPKRPSRVSKHTVDRLMRQEGMHGLMRGPPDPHHDALCRRAGGTGWCQRAAGGRKGKPAARCWADQGSVTTTSHSGSLCADQSNMKCAPTEPPPLR